MNRIAQTAFPSRYIQGPGACKMLPSIVASFGSKGLLIVDPFVHDIVITDLNMPKISGIDIVSYIKEKSPETTVILTTGNTARIEKIKKENKLVNYFLNKPINFKDWSHIISLAPKTATGEK